MLMSTAPLLSWASACVTNVGTVRELNEDACLDMPEVGLWVVADGVGGHQGGEIASQLIIKSLAGIGAHDRLSEFVNEVEDRLLEVHGDLVHRAQGKGPDMTIGSTIAALLVAGEYGVCLWAGDSRIYRYRDGQLEQITQDHSHVEELIARGALEREQANKHPWSNVITRAVGAGDELFLDAELQKLQSGDQYLICSDGLYKEVSEAVIAEHLGHDDSMTICQRLVSQSLEQGADDNVTVLVVQFI